jgi:hypothetical protein
MLPAGTGGADPRADTPTDPLFEHLSRTLPRITGGNRAVEYVTAADIHDRWPDVRPALVRLWVHRGLLQPVRGPDGTPIRTKGVRGRANLYRWDDVVAAEKSAREAGSGRPRGR